mmetsp:Transcript_45708/g.85340  ORF Transcript_45708/g.85340 Transcript_45708/m.85340 type:complete len:210 (+) Transcript_45708:205-834(+)
MPEMTTPVKQEPTHQYCSYNQDNDNRATFIVITWDCYGNNGCHRRACRSRHCGRNCSCRGRRSRRGGNRSTDVAVEVIEVTDVPVVVTDVAVVVMDVAVLVIVVGGAHFSTTVSPLPCCRSTIAYSPMTTTSRALSREPVGNCQLLKAPPGTVDASSTCKLSLSMAAMYTDVPSRKRCRGPSIPPPLTASTTEGLDVSDTSTTVTESPL